MRRIKLTVAYDGCNYSGWQIQPNASTIEQVLDNAINKVTGGAASYDEDDEA